MRLAAAAIAVSLFFLNGCGYVGPVLPPSPEIPAAVNNLTVVEAGDQIVIQFSTPPRTTDNLAITEFSNVDVRVGPNLTPFDFNSWAAGAKPYDVELPARGDRDDPQPKPISLNIAAADWQGQRVAIAVRTSTRKKDHFSAWSNRVVVDVLPPLTPPQVHAEISAKGIALSWNAAPGTHYQISRLSPSDKLPVDLGNTDDSFFVDTSLQYDTEYRYSVVARSGAAESLPSKPVIVTASQNVDKFPPAVPASITALAGPSTVEVSWQRSPDADLQGYYVYRATNNGPLERQGALIKLPAYTDRLVEHGKTYRYQVSAVDQKGNESAKSTSVEAVF